MRCATFTASHWEEWFPKRCIPLLSKDKPEILCFLLAVIGITPRSGWAVDPFGHSATMPYLLKRANLTSMLIQRIHYSIKKHFASTRNLEFMWRQAWGEWTITADVIWFMCLSLLSSLPNESWHSLWHLKEEFLEGQPVENGLRRAAVIIFSD